MPEFCGDDVRYFDPDSPAQLAELLATTLAGTPRRPSPHVTLPAWSVVSERTWEAIRSVRG